MKIQVLPSWCKRVGVGLFIVGFGVFALDGILAGWNYPQGVPQTLNYKSIAEFLGGRNLVGILMVLGSLVYLLSKEKVEDEYIQKLRAENFQTSATLLLLVAFLCYMFVPSFLVSLDEFIIIFWILYVIVSRRKEGGA